MYQVVLVCTQLYQYVPEHTGLYQNFQYDKYIPVHSSTEMYVHVHTGTYKYIPEHTRTYQYIPGFQKGANRSRTRNPLHAVGIISRYTISVHWRGCNTGYANFRFGYVYILVFIYLPVYLALDDGSTAPVQLSPRPARAGRACWAAGHH